MCDFENIPAETPLSPAEAVIRRHRREKKELQGKILALKKAITKNDKKKKKELADEIQKLEEDLERRHKEELSIFVPERELENLALVQEEVESKPDDKNDDSKVQEKELKEVVNNVGKGVSKAQKRREKKAAAEKERILRIEKETEELQHLNNDANEEELKLSQILKELKLEIVEIPSDGHCLYKAISHQLSNFNEESSVSELRQKTSNYLRENKTDFISFMDEKVGKDEESYEKYCKDIELTAVWGGMIEIRAMSQILKRPIKVIQSEGAQIVIGEEFNPPELVLTYHRHKIKLGAHYNAALPAKE